MTIFDLVRAPEIASYWQEMTQDAPPYLGETLFPPQKKLGLNLSWLKGKKGLPVALKLSAFDVKAVPRQRIGMEKMATDMPFFKESMYVDEELRQELNKVMESGNSMYIDAVMNRIFDDSTTLLEAARVARERMRMQLITTGEISLASNGQAYDYDYGLDASTQKVNAATAWTNNNADIISDIRGWQDAIEDATGIRPNRAVCSRKTWSYMLKNLPIKKTIAGLSDGTEYLSDAKLRTYLTEELDMTVTIYSKRFMNDSGVAAKYIPDDTFILLPPGNLGNTWFGTTPEESDLMSSSTVENVAIVDTGVAVTTIKQSDPVNVEIKVTQICLPDFPTADQIVIADVTPA